MDSGNVARVNQHPRAIHVLLLILLVLMPIDSFAPGAALLREFGGRPFNLILMAVIVVSAIIRPREWFNYRWDRAEFTPYVLIFAGLGISTVFFLVNEIQHIAIASAQRTPIYSFISQLSVFFTAILFILFLRRFCELYRHVMMSALPKIFLWVAAVHLFFFAVQFLLINGLDIVPVTALLNWIRVDAGTMRPFGLMSEPSYWGAFVAYIWPILFFCFDDGSVARRLSRTCALLLIGTALFIGARTLIGIVFVQALILVLSSRINTLVKLILLIVCAAGGMLGLILSTDIFAVSDNLSSAMRLGSTLLALNVAGSYGLFGVGVGQFHYYFTPEFAPNFLLLSSEAANIFGDVSDFRASTFNFYVRLMVELGVIGMLGYMMLIVRAGRSILHLPELNMRRGLGLAYVGAMAFWLTQDSFLYSPALFFIALGLSLSRAPAVHSTQRAMPTLPKDFL